MARRGSSLANGGFPVAISMMVIPNDHISAFFIHLFLLYIYMYIYLFIFDFINYDVINNKMMKNIIFCFILEILLFVNYYFKIIT